MASMASTSKTDPPRPATSSVASTQPRIAPLPRTQLPTPSSMPPHGPAKAKFGALPSSLPSPGVAGPSSSRLSNGVGQRSLGTSEATVASAPANGQQASSSASAAPVRPSPLKRESTADTRTSTDIETEDEESNQSSRDTKMEGASKKASSSKKKKANRACAACQKAHLTCDDARPCTRCVKKGIGEQCTDGKRKRAKYLLDEDELEAVRTREKEEKTERGHLGDMSTSESPSFQHDTSQSEPYLGPPSFSQAPQNLPLTQALYGQAASAQQTSAMFMLPQQTTTAAGADGAPPIFDGSMADFGIDAGADYKGPAVLQTSDNTPPYTFGSEATSLEYSILSAMLNGIDPNLLSGPADDGSGGNPYGGPSGMTPGNSSLDLAGFLGGQNMPSVGMATDTSSYWMNSGATSAAPSAPSPTPWHSSSAMAPVSNGLPMGTSDPASQTLGQLHAIGGHDSKGLGGEVGSGGFKALEVPSPSPSLASARLGRDDGSSPADSVMTHVGAVGKAQAGTAVGPSLSGPSGQVASASTSQNNRPPSAFEAQWRERVSHIYGDRTKPFSYTDGYHFLLKFVTEKFEKAEVLRIVRALGLFRPSLIALQMPLTEEDEVFVERSIQRTILEFEKLISFSGTPTVVWRRTCEICVVGSEFSMLTGWSRDALLGRRIYEFWEKKATLEYWETFAVHAFENTTQSIVTNVVFQRPDGTSVPCAACFSIKRNVFDLPSLVVGAFLPILSST